MNELDELLDMVQILILLERQQYQQLKEQALAKDLNI